MEIQTTNIIIVGGGREGTALVEAFQSYKSIRILGVFDKNDRAPGIELAGMHGISTGSNYRLFLNVEGLNYIINVTGSEKVQEDILMHKPEEVGLIDGRSAKLLRNLIQENALTAGSLKRTYAQTEQLINVISAIIISIDERAHITQWNRAAEKIFGISAADALGKSFKESGIKWNRNNIPDLILGCGKQCEQERLDDIPFVRTDGRDGFLGITLYPLEKGNGLLILGADITERRIMDNQLIQSQKLESIGQLAAGVAHEINNPVGFISSNLTTLDEYRGDIQELISLYKDLETQVAASAAGDPILTANLEKLRVVKDKMDLQFILDDFAKVISESREGTDRVKKIVQDLKDFSHVDQAEIKRADINKGLDSTLNIAWNEIKYKATVTKEYGDIPQVSCFPQQINQVFMNILVNAAQAIEDHGHIRIATTAVPDQDNPMVEVRISDNGKGISPDHLPRIFDPFFTTKAVGKGTGLGLSIAHSIIQKHQGKIKVESELNKGTTFIIRLPVKGPQE